MDCRVVAVIQPDRRTRLSRPLVSSYVPAGFPSPAEDYVEGRIDLNRDLIRHPLTTFYIRVVGDSMVPEIHPGSLLIVDRGMPTGSGNIVVARINDELCIKKLSIEKDGRIALLSENPRYKPILITEAMDFEVWGRVMHSIRTH
jgi:DNA polymerase V